MTLYQMVLMAFCMVGLLGCLVFVIRYQVRSRGAWRDSEAGRWLMIGRAEKAALFALVIAGQAVPNWPGRQAVTVAVFGAFVALTWWPSRLLSRATDRPRRTENEEVAR